MSKLRDRIKTNLADIKARDLRRELKPPAPGSIDLSSNDYLWLANDERLNRAAITEIERGGVGATASRLLRGEREIFARLEQRFADFKQTERSLYYGSGYAANIGLLTTFLEAGDVVFSDALNHASIIDGLRLAKAQKVVFPHNDAAALNKLMRETPCEGRRFLVTESLFSMDGDFAPLHEYVEICRKSDTNLIVDEAHAVGVFGANGSGLIAAAGIAEEVFLSINTAGKALGVAGAFVAGESWAIEYLIQKSRSFIFSTAPPPALAAALIAALEIVENDAARRRKLLNLSLFLRSLLIENDVPVSLDDSHIVSIIIGDSGQAVELAKKLQCENFDVRAIRPPTVPVNTARLRISLNSNLSEDVLRKFIFALCRHLRQLRHGS